MRARKARWARSGKPPRLSFLSSLLNCRRCEKSSRGNPDKLAIAVDLYLRESKASGRRRRTGLGQKKARTKRMASTDPQTRSQTPTYLSLVVPLLQQSSHPQPSGNIGVHIGVDAAIWPAGKATCESMCQRECTDIARPSARATRTWTGTEREPEPRKPSMRNRWNDGSRRPGLEIHSCRDGP